MHLTLVSFVSQKMFEKSSIVKKYSFGFISTPFILVLIHCLPVTQLVAFNAEDSVAVKTNVKHGQLFNFFQQFNYESDHRISSYCNPPTQIKRGSECFSSEFLNASQLQLTSITLVIRHGDRGPVRNVTDLKSVNCNPYDVDMSGRLHSLLTKDQKRIFKNYKEFIKSSGQYSSYALKTVFPDKECPLGNLSAIGSLQQLILGNEMSRIYKNLIHLESKKIKVFTTNYSRTFHSAVAFLFGFLDDGKEAPVTTHIIPKIDIREESSFCGSGLHCAKCDTVDELQRSLDNYTNDFVKSIEDVFHKVRRIIADNGQDKTFSTIVTVFDGLMTYLCHDHGLPCKGDCVTANDVSKVLSTMEASWKQSAVISVYQKLNFLKMFGFLHQLSDRFDSVMKAGHLPLVLFSGHDVTLVPLLSALNLFDGVIPPYASRLIFETYQQQQNESNTVNHYLRIIYNGKDLTGATEICMSNNCVKFTDSKSNQTLLFIRLERFKIYISDKLKQFTHTDTFENACKLNSSFYAHIM